MNPKGFTSEHGSRPHGVAGSCYCEHPGCDDGARPEVEIRKAPTLEILNELADVAAGLQRRWKPVKDVADWAGECWVAADVRRGQELANKRAMTPAEKQSRYRGKIAKQRLRDRRPKACSSSRPQK
jgi:hypothetical protein